ncbi:hypothetical protein H0H93_016769 [Arthromyces matolae]|nr:hypothetical protein H0H93_016769 [Arthromyces matolae]
MPRRSSRLAGFSVDNTSASDATITLTTAPGLFKNVSGRGGVSEALSGIAEMPLDILYETFLYLTSVDILHLSRTSKSLRRVLITNSAQYVWKRARVNFGYFLECPDDLNEAQFAALIFDELCDVRLIAPILYGQTVDAAVINASTMEKLACFREVELEEHAPEKNRYDIFEEYATSLFQDYLKLSGVARDEWVQARLQERQRRIQKSGVSNIYVAKRKKLSQDYMVVCSNQYLCSIEKRLDDIELLGWGEEFRQCCRQWIKNGKPWLTQPRELTDRGWDNIKYEVMKDLKPVRAKLEKEMKKNARHLNRK